MAKLRFGIVATGGIARKFARTAPLVDEIELAGVASRTLDKAEAFAQQWGIAQAYGSYEEMFADPAIDAVYISTPHNFHKQNVIDAARAGKHILCEKPLGLNRIEDEEMFRAAKENGVFLMEAMWTRFLPCTMKAREWVQGGQIGDVRLITAPFGMYREYKRDSRLFAPTLAGGALYDLGVYTTEFILDFAQGKTLANVKGVHTDNDMGTDMTTSAVFLFDDGAQANMTCSFEYTSSHEGFVYGDKGHVRFDNFQIPKRVELYVGGELRDTAESEFESGFEYEIRHMADCVAKGILTSPIMPPQDTLACADVFEQIL